MSPRRTTPRATFLLDLVHIDVCGPIEIPLVSEGRYFISCFDDYSNWIMGVPKYKNVRREGDLHSFRKVAEPQACRCH